MNHPRRRAPSRRKFLSLSAASSAALALSPTFAESLSRTASRDPTAVFLRQLEGDAILPGSPQFETARRVFCFDPSSAPRPVMIVRCQSESDIARSLEYARSQNLEVAVRGGGHDVLAASTTTGGIVIDLGKMKSIDPAAADGTVRVAAGTLSGALNIELQKIGRAVALGGSSLVGISGLTLGGGIGWLAGTHGATCDNLVSANIVTVDGRMLRATAEDNSDLFWAIRGGGGNFGIASSFTYRSLAVGSVVGGYIAYSIDRLTDFLHFYREFIHQAPNELTLEVFVQSVPNPLIRVTVCYLGTEQAADFALAPLRKFGPPLLDAIRAAPYSEVAVPTALTRAFLHEPNDATEKNDLPGDYFRGSSLDSISDAAIDIIEARLKDAPRGCGMAMGFLMHGAICDVAPTETPLPRSKGKLSYDFNTCWSDRARAPSLILWVQESASLMRPHSSAATYINFLSNSDSASIRQAYGPNYERLRAIKRKYDPDNILHRNRNIAPAV